MDNKKAYIKVECSKESPTKSGDYFTDYDRIWFDLTSKEWSSDNDAQIEPYYWLKEIDLTELILEYSNKVSINSDPTVYRQSLNRRHINDFLTSKGIQL